jgi:biotin transport system substrate-specific component
MQPNLTLAEYAPLEKKSALANELFLILGSSFLIALSAQVAFGWPVPITGQTFAIILIAIVLGSKRATLAVLAYICEGVAGLPVFAQFKFGLAALLGPTGGYIIGFLAAAFIVGVLTERIRDKNIIKIFFAILTGLAIIYIFGILWLCVVLKGASFLTVLKVGLFPFIPGEVIKITFALALLRRLSSFSK